MNYLRCKCGKVTSTSSYSSAKDCEGCEECNTTLAVDPSLHKVLKEHTWVTKYNQNTGKPFKICSVCDHIDSVSYKESNVI